MTREEAIKVFGELNYAYKADEYGDYFYDHGDEVCQAASVAIAAMREQVNVVEIDQFKTNADHIRSMTDEELAETIVREFCAVSDNTIEFIVAKTRFRLWLKQPYGGDT